MVAANVSSSVIWQLCYVQGKHGNHVSSYEAHLKCREKPHLPLAGLPLCRNGMERQAVFYLLKAEGETGICALLIQSQEVSSCSQHPTQISSSQHPESQLPSLS